MSCALNCNFLYEMASVIIRWKWQDVFNFLDFADQSIKFVLVCCHWLSSLTCQFVIIVSFVVRKGRKRTRCALNGVAIYFIMSELRGGRYHRLIAALEWQRDGGNRRLVGSVRYAGHVEESPWRHKLVDVVVLPAVTRVTSVRHKTSKSNVM